MFSFFEAIGRIIGKIFEAIVDGCLFLLRHPKVLLLIVILIASGYAYYRISSHISQLNSEIAELEKQRVIWVQSKAIYESNIRLITQINREAEELIQALANVNSTIEKNKIELEKKNLESRRKINNLLQIIKSTKPEENGPVAPVLRNTIQSIDEERQDRNKMWRNQ
jgi:hypothetical protein